MISFKVNGRPASFEGEADTPLLWVLRDHLELTGTKYGCGVGLCSACTVHLEGRAARSCQLPVSSVEGKSLTTIEGLAASEDSLHPVQKAWLELDVPQCGYCQAGQIMATVDLLNRIPRPTDKDIDEQLSGMICRCGTYVRIRKAVHRAAELARSGE
jgi:aerobic-type carbon monoxide dehydrogenase small subunit (CoxS/CutS family)